ncbi:MAG: energy transducer TonB [Burkholderiales bacterium]
MDFSRNEVSPVRRFGGLSIVVLLHALVAYALITGLARKIVDVIKQPVETKIIEEVKPPPPPDTPPPPPPPKMAAPPPPFIPPPEVQIQQPVSQNAITAVTSVQPPAQQFSKTVAPPAKVAAPVAPPVPAFADLNGCKPEYPRASQLAQEEGTVRVQFVVGPDAQLLSATVLKSSGYKNLDKATVNGLSRCKFKAAYMNGKAVQSTFITDYVWKLDE